MGLGWDGVGWGGLGWAGLGSGGGERGDEPAVKRAQGWMLCTPSPPPPASMPLHGDRCTRHLLVEVCGTGGQITSRIAAARRAADSAAAAAAAASAFSSAAANSPEFRRVTSPLSAMVCNPNQISWALLFPTAGQPTRTTHGSRAMWLRGRRSIRLQRCAQ